MIASASLSPVPEPADILEESVTIAAPAGALAGVLAYPLAGAPTSAGLVIGPHPQMGGRLENNVVRAVGRGLAECGRLALRFAYAGAAPTAESMDAFWRTGHAPEDPQRMHDALAAARWLRNLNPSAVVLVGYSFGASLLAPLLDQLPVVGIVLISPTLVQHDFSALAICRVPKLLIVSDNDFATPLETARGWFSACAESKTLAILPSAEHFFRGQEQSLVNEIARWL
jgi:alpha/beta superfamily hydrolase